MSKERKRRGLLRRILRALCLVAVAALLYSWIGAYAPFARFPELEDAAAADADVSEMLRDIDTEDRAAILETSTAALDERIRLMAQAEKEIVITTYECHDGESTRDLLAVACHRAREGVRVRLLADGIAGRMDIMPNEYFIAAASLPNVEIRFYNLPSPLTPWRHMGRMHDKYVIADGLGYILGGRNMYDGFLGDYPTRRHRSHDREVLVYNGAHGGARTGESSLYRLMDYFEAIWAQPDSTPFSPSVPEAAARDALLDELEVRYLRIREEKPELFLPADYASMTEPTRGVWLLSNPTDIYAKRPTLFAQLCALMRTAKRDIVIHSPYAVLNRPMRECLAEIAERTPVTLMVNAVENGANVVAGGDYLYHRDEVISVGTRLLEYAGGVSYHGKSVAIDGDLSIVGSFNLDLRSAFVDTELMLVVRGPEINAQLRRHMEALHADCREVIDAVSSTLPEGLEIEPLPLWRRAALRVIGGVMQLCRNLI